MIISMDNLGFAVVCGGLALYTFSKSIKGTKNRFMCDAVVEEAKNLRGNVNYTFRYVVNNVSYVNKASQQELCGFIFGKSMKKGQRTSVLVRQDDYNDVVSSDSGKRWRIFSILCLIIGIDGFLFF